MTHLFLWSTTHLLKGETPETVLSIAEVSRANMFKFQKFRDRFVAGRVWLRTILGQHLGCDPARIGFETTEHGKPYVSAPDREGLSFSYSRSHDCSVCAVAINEAPDSINEIDAIGIDLERIADVDPLEPTAQIIFNSPDFLVWKANSENDRLAAFHRAWTRKEAIGKALGTGISTGPRNIPAPLEACDKGHVFKVHHPDGNLLALSDWPGIEDFQSSVAVVISDETRCPGAYTDASYEAGAMVEMFAVPADSNLTIRRFTAAGDHE